MTFLLDYLNSRVIYVLKFKDVRFSNNHPVYSLKTFNFLTKKELSQNPPEGIVAGPVNEDNFFEWESLITYSSVLIFVFLNFFFL